MLNKFCLTYVGRRSQPDSQKRAFLLRSFYAWVLPLLLVMIALSIDISGAMDVRYGRWNSGVILKLKIGSS
jgi:hypothetical protein